MLWVVVPTLFYSAPPGDVAEVLSVGHAFKFGSELGPPLAHWLAEIALRAAGGHMFGVYVLSQICIVATYWAVFQLGRATDRRSARGAGGPADGRHLGVHDRLARFRS